MLFLTLKKHLTLVIWLLIACYAIILGIQIRWQVGLLLEGIWLIVALRRAVYRITHVGEPPQLIIL